MSSAIEHYEAKMVEFITEYEELTDRIATLGGKVDKENEALIYIKEDIANITKEVEDDARNIQELGTEYVKPDGPPPMVKLSYALQLMYTVKVSLTLLETEHTRLKTILEMTLKRAEDSKMDYNHC